MKSLLPSLPAMLLLNALSGVPLAHAQYVWKDDKGVTSFSDKPPPSDVPAKNIIRAPQLAALQAPTPASQTAPDAPAEHKALAKEGTEPKGPPTLADKEADFRKRAKEKQDQEQKARAQAQQKAAQRQQCREAAAYKAQLDSGERIRVTAANGERAFMDDAQRAKRQADMARMLAQCK
jgi:hypothetical protein